MASLKDRSMVVTVDHSSSGWSFRGKHYTVLFKKHFEKLCLFSVPGLTNIPAGDKHQQDTAV